jgi:hypothetical protein
MHFEPHATLGWVIGNLGGGDRRVRNYCTLGAVLPDIDAAAYVFGPLAYGEWHHTFGHNVFLWAAFTGWVGWRCRSWRAALLAFLSFGSHLLTDAQFSGWKQYWFWPVSREGYLFSSAVQLEHPINYWLVYVSFLVVGLVAVAFKRAPIDIFSPKLDWMVVAFFRKKDRSCATCGRACNQNCDGCAQSVCLRHGSVRRRMRLLCPACVGREREKS